MAKIDKQLLIKFGPKEPDPVITQAWPVGSKFLKLVLGPEGIYTFFEVPEMLSVGKEGSLDGEEWVFAVIKPGTGTQSGDEFLDIITAYTEVPPAQLKEQGLPSDFQTVVVFTFYLRKKPSLIKTM
jgi:hypothetical protein